jgi:hypothetical protein
MYSVITRSTCSFGCSGSFCSLPALPVDNIHPLLHRLTSDAEKTIHDFRTQMKTFRPSMTVFEVDAMKKGQAAPDFIRHKRSAHGAKITSEREKQRLRLEGTRSSSSSSSSGGGGGGGGGSEADGKNVPNSKRNSMVSLNSAPVKFGAQVNVVKPKERKRKMSKAERKRMAKRGSPSSSSSSSSSSTTSTTSTSSSASTMDEFAMTAAQYDARQASSSSSSSSSSGSLNGPTTKHGHTSYKDPDNYLSMVPADKATEDGYAVAQQSKYGDLEDAMMDLNSDSHEGLLKDNRKRTTYWDRKKKKYIQIALSEIDQITGKRKKPSDGHGGKKTKKTLQSQYDKWSDKTKRSIARVGAMEEGRSNDIEVAADWRNGYRSANKKTSDGIVKTYIGALT